MKKFFLAFTLMILILVHIGIGVGVGFIIGYWRGLPPLDPLEYKETSSWKLPSKVYSDVCEVKRGDTIEFLLDKLKRLEYVRVKRGTPRIGQFILKANERGFGDMMIYLREFEYPHWVHKPQLVRLRIEDGVITDIKDEKGRRIESFFIEPELIAELYSPEGTDRELIHLTEVPDDLVKAFLAIEDNKFYEHWGISIKRILGALYYNLRTWSLRQGASTITQQLARNLFLTPKRSWRRKIKEALMAIKIEMRFSKDEILERYLNFIDLGRYGSREVYGVQQAAKYYFRKPVWELTLPECALIAALPRSPTLYSPIRHPDNALRRRNLVLRRMLENGYITESEYREAVKAPLGVYPIPSMANEAPYFVDFLRQQLERRYSKTMLYTRGLKIYTTLDMSMQEAANKAVHDGLAKIDERLGLPPYDKLDPENPELDPLGYPQAALVAIEPETGYIRAMVGGRDYDVSQFNRAVQARRQPGSVFKPFVYCAAYEARIATPADTIDDSPWALKTPAGVWAPKNYTGRFYGRVTLRKALERSINVATAKFFYYKVGARRVINLARRMGIRSPLKGVPSLALGSSELSLFELTSAYGIWAALGIRAEPIWVKYVVDRNGDIIEENLPKTRRVLSEAVAYQMVYQLEGVIEEGTGRRAKGMGFSRPAGGKTGTTSRYTDAWFIGFTPDLVAGVWTGFDDPSLSIQLPGSQAALPIWTDFMKRACRGYVKDFKNPNTIDGVVFREIDKNTGLLYNPGKCPPDVAMREVFLKGTEPTKLCDAHD